MFGVDVGYGLVDLKIREHPKTIILEKTNARNLKKYDLEPEAKYQVKNENIAHDISLVVMDVSFISITTILPQLVDLVSENCEFICLVKPQFEAAQSDVGKKGIIKDPEVHAKVLGNVIRWAISSKLTIQNLVPSPITGTKGNREFFLVLGH